MTCRCELFNNIKVKCCRGFMCSLEMSGNIFSVIMKTWCFILITKCFLSILNECLIVHHRQRSLIQRVAMALVSVFFTIFSGKLLLQYPYRQKFPLLPAITHFRLRDLMCECFIKHTPGLCAVCCSCWLFDHHC